MAETIKQFFQADTTSLRQQSVSSSSSSSSNSGSCGSSSSNSSSGSKILGREQHQLEHPIGRQLQTKPIDSLQVCSPTPRGSGSTRSGRLKPIGQDDRAAEGFSYTAQTDRVGE